MLQRLMAAYRMAATVEWKKLYLRDRGPGAPGPIAHTHCPPGPPPRRQTERERGGAPVPHNGHRRSPPFVPSPRPEGLLTLTVVSAVEVLH